MFFVLVECEPLAAMDFDKQVFLLYSKPAHNKSIETVTESEIRKMQEHDLKVYDD